MSRCCICDRSTDIEPYQSLRLTYNKREHGYVCEECNYEIYSSLEELLEKDEEANRISHPSSDKL
jgi:uncharacterized protein YlaI